MPKSAEELKREKQHLALLKQKTKHAKKMEELTKKRREMSKELNEQEMELLNQEIAFCQININCHNEIMRVREEKERYNEFRSSSLKMVRQFNKFQNLFIEDVKAVKSILSANGKLVKPETLANASEKLRGFLDDAQNLIVIEDRELPKDLADQREDLVQKSEELQSLVDELISEISMEDQDKESLKYIKEQYGKAEEAVAGLVKVVPKFNIPASKRFEQAVIHQMKIVSSAMPQIGHSAPKAITLDGKQGQLEDQPDHVEEQINVLANLMDTITNITCVLEEQPDQELVKDMISEIQMMFGYLDDLSVGEEEDDEMSQIRQLVAAIMTITSDVV
uniref:SNF7 family protein n=1 Tax=Caenorhabditis tropicalis TaxID=1561998 RepID=A0A1I7UGG3_9PELO